MADWFIWVMAIPITAIVLGVGSEMWKQFLQHKERALEIRAGSQKNADSSVTQQIDALREEVARLRDTSTQYDISIQHTLEELQQRVAYLEDKTRTAPAVSAAKEAEESARLART